MSEKAPKNTNKRDPNADRKSLENILREPLTRHRLYLKNKLIAATNPESNDSFTFDDLERFVKNLPSEKDSFRREVVKALDAVKTGSIKSPVNFKLPENQLVWAAAMNYVLANPDVMQGWDKPVKPEEFYDSEFWTKTVNSVYALKELREVGGFVNEALRDKDVKYAYARPGETSKYDAARNRLAINFVDGLISGTEHMRALAMREIGRALHSRELPTRLKELQQEIIPLMRRRDQAKKGKKKKNAGQAEGLSPQEYKELMMKTAEYNLREMLYEAAEKNARNTFAARRGQVKQQDFSVSLNNSGVTAENIGLERAPMSDDIPDALTRFMNLVNAVNLNFYQKNGLFTDTNDGWRGAGVDPDLVRKIKKNAPLTRDNQGIEHEDFKDLRNRLSGEDGLDKKMPKLGQRIFGNFDRKAELASQDRNKIIEGIEKDYAEDLIRDILDFYSKKLDEQLEKNQEQSNDNDQNDQSQSDPNQSNDQNSQDQQQGDPQEGQQGEPQEGQQGEPQEGQQGEPQEGQQGEPQEGQQGEPQEGQQGEPQEGQQGEPQEGQQGEPQDGQQGEPQEGQQGEPQDGQQGEPREGQQGEPQEGQQGEPQEGQQGEPQEGQDGQAQEGDEGINAQGADQELPDFAKDRDMDGQDGQEGQQQEGQDGQQQDGQDGQQGEPQDGQQGQQGDGDDTVPVDGHGDMPDAEGSESLDEAQQQADAEQDGQDGQDADGQDGQEGQDADGQDGADGDGMTMEELEQAMKEQAQQDADGQDADGDGEANDNQKKSDKAGTQQGKDLGELSRESWIDYDKRVAELMPVILRVRKMFKKVQERQLQEQTIKSKKLEILPKDGEVLDRFNIEAHKNLMIKKAMGDVSEDDLRRFHTDETEQTPTTIDLVIAIDGSGSMKGVPLNSALQTAAILNEAVNCKEMKVNVYVAMWGNDNPPILIRPGMSKKEIGAEMERARPGLHSGTTMHPVFAKIAEEMSKQQKVQNTLSGYTHVLIVSDGDIGDEQPSQKAIEELFSHSDKVTVDVAVLKGSKGSRMEQAAKGVKNKRPHQEVTVTLETDPNKIPYSMVNLLLHKIRKIGSFKAVPTNVKQREMRRAHKALKKNR